MKIKRIICDVDGTLFDSIPIKNEIFIDALSRQGIPSDFSRPIILNTISLTRLDRFKKVWSEFYNHEVPIEILNKLMIHANKKISSSYFPLIEGANDFVQTIGRQIPIDIVSSASDLEITQNFDLLGWSKLVNSITCGISNKENSFGKLLHQYGNSNTEYLSIGDTANDCIAAINVGVKFWALSQQLDSVILNSKFCLGYSKNLYPVIKKIKDQLNNLNIT